MKDTPFGKIPVEWGLDTISNVTELVTDYVANGSFKSLADNVNYLSVEDSTVLIRLVDYNNNFNGDFVYVNDHAYEFLSKSKLFGGEIIISNVGANVGTVFKCPKLNKQMTLGPNSVMLKFKGNDDFYFYWLKSPAGKHMLQSIVTGSAQPKFNKTNLRQLLVPIPPIDVQDKVAEVLSLIDNKIENNEKINRNLSEQMQSIFGSLFYSELAAGNKASLGDYLYIKGRIGWKGLKKDEYLDNSEYRIINGESLTVTGIDWNKAGYISEERYTESPEIMLQEGDILISKDGTIGKIGYVNMLDKPTSVASGIFVVRNLKPEEISTVFIYCLLNSTYFKSFIASRTEGSVIPHLYQKDFVTLEIPILSNEQIVSFNETITPIFNLFFTIQTENLRLSALRDILLPKLMSGELDISDLNI